MLENGFNCVRIALGTYLTPTRLSRFQGWRATGFLLAGLLFTCGATANAASNVGSAPAGKHVAGNYGKIPLSFEPNKGQTDPSVQFLSRGSGYSLFLTQDEVVLNLERHGWLPHPRRRAASPASPRLTRCA